MSQQSVAVVGDGNIAGNILNIFTGPRKGEALAMLELHVAFDALLNSKARYPTPKCYIDTRETAQAVVTDWICGRGEWAGKGIMWISGAPGVGKSAIVQTVCELLHADNGSKVWFSKFGLGSDIKIHGCYFFGKGLGDRGKASLFPATIAFQLCRSSSTCRDLIKKAVKAQPDILSATFPSQFRQLLTATAKKRRPFQSPITVVIDALDECNQPEDQVELLNLMLEAVTTTKMRFLIASRPEHQIHAFFQRDDVSQHTYHVRLDEETFNTSRDIEVFLRAEFARIRREQPHLCLPLPNGEDWPGNIVILQIRDDSDAQFMYPCLFIDYIDMPFFAPDQQLHNLLAARVFSRLDVLYHLILSRLHHYQGVCIRILAAIIAWSGSLSPGQIAGVLDEEVDVVTSIIMGPLSTLFKLGRTNPDSPISFIQASVRHYLQDINRSSQYYISSAHVDAPFIRILSRPLPSTSASDTLRRKALLGVLTWVMALEHSVKVPHIASLLGIAPYIVEDVIHGPMNALFRLDLDQNIAFSTPVFKAFLLDASRSDTFVVLSDKPDPLFIEILSRKPPSDPLQAYTQEVLVGVLSVVVALGNQVKVPQIASFLDVPSGLVEGVIYGPTKPLFALDSARDVDFSILTFKTFLLDANRAGKYFVSSDKPDAIFIQTLSRAGPPLSNSIPPSSQEALMRVLKAMVALRAPVPPSRIASDVGLDVPAVEGVVFGPARALFCREGDGDVWLFQPVYDFLQDANRASAFYMPPRDLNIA